LPVHIFVIIVSSLKNAAIKSKIQGDGLPCIFHRISFLEIRALIFVAQASLPANIKEWVSIYFAGRDACATKMSGEQDVFQFLSNQAISVKNPG
jgi:hypothetical protein